MDRVISLVEHFTYPLAAIALVSLGVFGLVRATRTSRGLSAGSAAAFAVWVLVVGYLTIGMRGNGAELNTKLFNFDGDPTQPVLNILLFVPLGILIATWGWRLLPVFAVGFVASFAIETTQFLMNDGRTADINDVIMNTLGAVVGWLAVFAVSRIAIRHARSSANLAA